MLPGFLPLALLNKFVRELQKQQRKAREMQTVLVELAADNPNELHSLADVIVAHANLVKSIDDQITYWLTLQLTKEQTHAIHRCQTIARELNIIQANVERLLAKLRTIH